MEEIKYDYICSGCSGELKVDAWCVWDADKQDFAVTHVFTEQDRWCVDCDSFMDIKEVNADIYDKNQEELF